MDCVAANAVTAVLLIVDRVGAGSGFETLLGTIGCWRREGCSTGEVGGALGFLKRRIELLL